MTEEAETLEFIERTLEFGEDCSTDAKLSFLYGAVRMLIRYIRVMEVDE